MRCCWKVLEEKRRKRNKRRGIEDTCVEENEMKE